LNSCARYGLAGLAGVLLVWVLAFDTTRDRFVSGDGVAQGALIAAIALGVVLTFRGSGVVNFANGTIAMYVAYVYRGLRAGGDLFLPPLPNPLALVEGVVHWFQSNKTFDLPDWPTKLSLGGSMSFWPALVLSLVFCVLFGLAIHVLIFKPLRDAPILAKVVASVGLFLLLQAIVVRRFATNPQTLRPLPFVDKDRIDLGIMQITEEGLFVTVLVIVFAFALWLLFQRTWFGLATRAAAENERGAVVLGFSPDLLAAVNWVLATTITGLLGIFVASIQSSVDPLALPALIVPALTAALVGGFRSFGLTTVAAFLLGMQKPLVEYVAANHDWYPRSGGQPIPGVVWLVPLVVIVAMLFLRGNALPERGAVSAGRMPVSPTPRRWSLDFAGPALVVLAAVAGMFWFTPAFRGALTNTLVGIIICLSIVVLTGFVGQISLAQMAFAGFAAFAVSKLSAEHGWPFPLPILLGAIVALIAGMIVALPALRVRGVNLAIVTFASAVAVFEAVFRNPSVNDPLYGSPVDTPTWIDRNQAHERKILWFHVGDGSIPNPFTTIFCLVVVVLLCYAVANLRRSNTGRQMLAIRSNERAAAAAGVNVSGTKVLAFAVSAFVAGLGGAVLAYIGGGATTERFTYQQSLVFFAFAYLGGIASVSGAIAGGFLVAGGLTWTFLTNVVGVPGEFTLLLGGLGLIVTAILNPDGIAGQLRSDALTLWSRVRPARRASTAAASSTAEAAT
jgi:branched-chain amino acid transport system permease protein